MKDFLNYPVIRVLYIVIAVGAISTLITLSTRKKKEKVSVSKIIADYAMNLINETELIDKLSRYDYAKEGFTDGYDSLYVDNVNTWSEVADAVRQGIISEGLYNRIFNLRHNTKF